MAPQVSAMSCPSCGRQTTNVEAGTHSGMCAVCFHEAFDAVPISHPSATSPAMWPWAEWVEEQGIGE